MRKLLAMVLLFGLSMFLAGCVSPMKGTTVSFLTLEHVVSEPVVDNSVRPVKRGESGSGGILGFNTGDASIGTAMRNGGITRVHHVDYSIKNILFLYSEVVTIVYGE